MQEAIEKLAAALGMSADNADAVIEAAAERLTQGAKTNEQQANREARIR